MPQQVGTEAVKIIYRKNIDKQRAEQLLIEDGYRRKHKRYSKDYRQNR